MNGRDSEKVFIVFCTMVQNTMNTFSEARYYLNVNFMVIYDQHNNIIAAALGLETFLPSTNSW